MAIDKSRNFITLVRLGFAARGLTYMLLGMLALGTSGKAMQGANGVFDYLLEMPLGSPLLWLVALGLLAYAVFKVISAIANFEHRGNDAKGAVMRIGDLASGVAHLALAYAAMRFANGDRASAGGDGSEQMAAPVMDFELGQLLIGIIGIGILIGGAMQLKQAVTGSFMKHIAGNAPRAIEGIGRAGFAARGVVFGIVGVSLIRAAWNERGTQIKGIGEALLTLRDAGMLYTLVAIGLLLFGAFSLVTVRYRILPDIQRGDLKPDIPRPRL